jgi:hypothetical protein
MASRMPMSLLFASIVPGAVATCDIISPWGSDDVRQPLDTDGEPETAQNVHQVTGGCPGLSGLNVTILNRLP